MLYYFIYYKLFKIASYTEKQWAKGVQMPEWLALCSFVILIILNLVFLLMCLFKIFNFTIVLTKEMALISSAVIFGVNYFLLIYKKKYVEIEKKFDRESQKDRNIKSFLFWLYLLLSFGFVIIFMI